MLEYGNEGRIMKILLNVRPFDKLKDYIIETMIDTGYICETRIDAREYIEMLINTKSITDVQYDQLINKVIDYSDEMLERLQ